jgi:hypothetical protein
MAYGLSTRASNVNEAPQPVMAGDANGLPRSWQALSEACRLAIVERALRPANDRIDGFPAAL